MPLSWPARGWGKAPQRHLQAPAPATAGGEPSRPHARLLLYPLVNHQFRQPPASQIGDRCSGCPSLLPTRGVPLPGFLLLRGSIKLKPLHKMQGKTNAQSSRLGLTKKKTTHQQEQRRDPHFSRTQALSLRQQNDGEDGLRAPKQSSLSITPLERLRRSPPNVPCCHSTAFWSQQTPRGGGVRTLPTRPQETPHVGFAFTYTAPPSQLPRCASE